MKRVDRIDKIPGFGCVLVRHGRKHDWYRNPTTGVCQPVPRHNGDPRGFPPMCLTFDGERVVTDTGLLAVRALERPLGIIANLAARQQLPAHRALASTPSRPSSPRLGAFSANGQRVATASMDGTVRLWGDRGAPLGMLKCKSSRARGLLFHPSGLLLVDSSDGKMRLWDVASLQEVSPAMEAARHDGGA